MLYPSISDYITSIRSAEDNFDKLSHLRPVLDGNDNPIMSSGNFAVVFKMTDGTKDYAVKCFMREQDGRNEAYRMIAEELEYVSSPYIAGIKYYEKELFVDSQATQETDFPVLLMDWVDGIPLDKYIAKNISDTYNLKMVAYQFGKLAGWLLTQPFAHGDLKPDNILVTSEGLPVLVDYDGMYVPAMKGQKARELGSPDYRHPQRTDDDFNEHIDDFALASIALSLKAISLDPSLLSRYGATERLLFSAQDYREIDKSEAIRSITSLFYDDELTRLYALFLVAHASKNLAHVSFRLLDIKKTEIDNSLSCTKKAAEQGYADAQFNLGKCYANGDGVPQDYTEAVKWYKKAAEQGNAHAQNSLGDCYYYGKGVQEDDTEAVKWFKKAAEQGDAYAQCNLGNCYNYGKGVPQDYTEAVKWYKKAAEQGCAEAHFILGKCYKSR